MDSAHLEQLYQRYHRELYLYLFSLCHDRDLAEDLLQETFLKALLSLSESHGNLRAWLYLVARNLYFNHRKRSARTVAAEDPDLFPAHGGDPLDSLLTDERTRLLYQGLSRLQTRTREILQMQYFGSLSQREIAAILHLTPEHVRVLAYRGRRTLKEWMEANAHDLS